MYTSEINLNIQEQKEIRIHLYFIVLTLKMSLIKQLYLHLMVHLYATQFISNYDFVHLS